MNRNGGSTSDEDVDGKIPATDPPVSARRSTRVRSRDGANDSSSKRAANHSSSSSSTTDDGAIDEAGVETVVTQQGLVAAVAAAAEEGSEQGQQQQGTDLALHPQEAPPPPEASILPRQPRPTTPTQPQPAAFNDAARLHLEGDAPGAASRNRRSEGEGRAHLPPPPIPLRPPPAGPFAVAPAVAAAASVAAAPPVQDAFPAFMSITIEEDIFHDPAQDLQQQQQQQQQQNQEQQIAIDGQPLVVRPPPPPPLRRIPRRKRTATLVLERTLPSDRRRIRRRRQNVAAVAPPPVRNPVSATAGSISRHRDRIQPLPLPLPQHQRFRRGRGDGDVEEEEELPLGVHELDVSNNDLGVYDPGCRRFAELLVGRYPYVPSNRNNGGGIRPSQLYNFAGSCNLLYRLRILNMSGNRIDAEGAKLIADFIRHLPFLSRIDLSNNCIGDDGCCDIANALAGQRQEQQRIGIAAATTTGTATDATADTTATATTSTQPSSQPLLPPPPDDPPNDVVHGPGGEDDSEDEDTTVVVEPPLRTLMLNQNEISDVGCMAMATALRANGHLCVLHMNRNPRLTDASLIALGDTLRHINSTMEIIGIGEGNPSLSTDAIVDVFFLCYQNQQLQPFHRQLQRRLLQSPFEGNEDNINNNNNNADASHRGNASAPEATTATGTATATATVATRTTAVAGSAGRPGGGVTGIPLKLLPLAFERIECKPDMLYAAVKNSIPRGAFYA